MTSLRRFAAHAVRAFALAGAFLAVPQAPLAGELESEWTSEERGPINCPTGYMIDSVSCRGDYCDDMKITCTKQDLGNISIQYWTTEAMAYGRLSCTPAPANGVVRFMTGLKCIGDYCGALQIQCTGYDHPQRGTVITTDWYTEGGRLSDETGTDVFPPGYFPLGVYCAGRHCDNIRFELGRIGYQVLPPGSGPEPPLH